MDGAQDTAVGKVPRVNSHLTVADTLGHWRVRWGIRRDDYKVDPGLYALGNPSTDSPVVVTANYKLTFDVVRTSLPGLDVWLLALDTRGINVWCAAGKGTFSTDELVDRARFERLDEILSHRRLIVPQLGATGVAAHKVRESSGFSVTFGPIRVADLPDFIAAGMRARPEMRRPTFTLRERFVLTSVELAGAWKPTALVIVGFIMVGLAVTRPLTFGDLMLNVLRNVTPLVVALIGGAVVTPLLLPWLPPRAFAAKGAIVGIILAAATIFAMHIQLGAAVSLLLAMPAITSYIAMNFTGSTPFTALSGVEREMRRWIPLQAGAVALAVIVSIVRGFV
ncbi:MAG: mercury methylation corrinoid protein HgcA [Chloroflexi bacterium]|nr:mercury methylation corrinoid protein HgcA [Chloroflexota bacterium]